MQVVY